MEGKKAPYNILGHKSYDRVGCILYNLGEPNVKVLFEDSWKNYL